MVECRIIWQMWHSVSKEPVRAHNPILSAIGPMIWKKPIRFEKPTQTLRGVWANLRPQSFLLPQSLQRSKSSLRPLILYKKISSPRPLIHVSKLRPESYTRLQSLLRAHRLIRLVQMRHKISNNHVLNAY